LKDALKHFNFVLMTWPEHGDVYYHMGRAYSGLSNYKEAIKSLRRARELLPQHVPSGILLAYQYQRSTRLEEARALVEQLLAQSRQLSTSQASELHALLGQLLQESSEPGAPQRALDELRKAVELSPDNALLHQQFGMACLQAGKTELAQQAFTEAIRLNPNVPAPYQQLSSIYSRRGDKAMAAEMARLADGMLFNQQQQQKIERLSQENPKNVSLHLILAERYQSLGLVKMARSRYRLALRYDPRNTRAKAGLEYLARQPNYQARVTN
jgi:tetratricopeptide (TPR) repeat protein